MANPISPVVPGMNLQETIYAKDHPKYLPLPAFKFEDGCVMSRWKLSWKERIIVFLFGSIYLWQLTFNKPLQPVKIEAHLFKTLRNRGK